MNLEQQANASQRLSAVPADATDFVVSRRSAPAFTPVAATLVLAALAADGDG